MESNPNQHLEMPELAHLLERSRQSPSAELKPEDAHPHFVVCASCREQFESLSGLDRELKSQLGSLQGSESTAFPADCPGAEVWGQIAGGLTEPQTSLAYIEHASRCDYCGPRLRTAVEEVIDLNEELTASEREQIASLDSARLEWQMKLAERISGSPRSDGARSHWWELLVPRLAIAAVAVIVVAAVGWSTWNGRGTPSSANHLLARAYTDQRTLELRIPGAAYAPLRVQRGPAASFAARPAALLKAEALIASQLGSHPDDPAWLQAAARANMLEGKYDAAVESLRRALELEPHSPELMSDLGTAHFQRAQSEDRQEDYGAAFEYFSKALDLKPEETTALFNRAIVAEHQFLYRQALDDWEHYLKLDSRSEWADEARSHAEAVRAKIKEHESGAAPLLSPDQVAQFVDGDANGSTNTDAIADIDRRVEQYLDAAVRSWLPQAYPLGKTVGDPHAQRALFFLADLTAQKHNDRWLSDLLTRTSAPDFPQAVAALARAVQANDSGEYSTSNVKASQAERLFRASGNEPGTLRAQFEQTFAAQIERRSELCRQQAAAALRESEKYSYSWLHIQLGLEESVCSLLMGDLGGYERISHRAQDRAQQAGYGALYLRALGFVADNKFDTGDGPGGWKLICTGLERYWSGQFSAMRGYNLYHTAGIYLGHGEHPNLSLAIWREAAILIDSDEDLLLRASVHNYMANAAIAAHRPEIAERQYAEATRLYALAPQSEAARANRLENEIRNAELEARQGALDAALARLTGVQDEVRQLSNNYLAQIFYSTLGDVQLGSHRGAEAEQAFWPALRLAEQNLASLTSVAERMSWSKDAAPVYLGLAEAELIQGREQESLDVFEWYLGAPQRVGIPGRTASKGASELSQSLPNRSLLAARLPVLSSQTVLAYGLLPDGLAIWVYDNRGVTAKWIPKSPQDLQDLAADFYSQCSDPKSDLSTLHRDGVTLYSLLIAPVERQLDPARSLVFETEGFLARLPFEALVDTSGRYLIERGPVVHSPGPYAEARMHLDTAIARDSSALIVASAASLPDNGLLVIPNVSAGADTIAGNFHSPHVLKGLEATPPAITKALPGAAVFHFAGHAMASPNHTGLLLAGRSARSGNPVLLDANLVRRLDVQNLQLAVLAACSTDSGEGGLRGFDSVAEALQTSGVPHVVASRWSVDSVEANVFANYFYGFLLAGDPVSGAAGLTSQKRFLNARTRHPYYWAAFAAYGRP